MMLFLDDSQDAWPKRGNISHTRLFFGVEIERHRQKRVRPERFQASPIWA